MATTSSLSLGCGPLARQTSARVPPKGRADGQDAERAERGAVAWGGGEVARVGGPRARDLPILAGKNTKSERNRRQIASFPESCKCGGAKPKSGRRRRRSPWREGGEEGVSLSSSLTAALNAIGIPDADDVGNVIRCIASGRAEDCLGITEDEGEGGRYGGEMEEGALAAAERIGGMKGADEGGEKQGERERKASSAVSTVGRRVALIMTGSLTATTASVSSMRGSWPLWKNSSYALANEGEEEALREIVAPDEVAEQTAMELSRESSSDGSEGSADLAMEANSPVDTSADSSAATSAESSVASESSGETTVVPEYASEQPSDGPRVTGKVYFDISVENEPLGRIVVGLYGQEAPIGAQRFADLAAGKGGISYRRKIFDTITPSFIENAGVRFNVSAQLADNESIAGGPSALPLIEEMKQQQNRPGGAIGNRKGAVSLVALTLNKEPPTQKLIAKNGKLVVVEEPGVPDPNGTEFAILRADAPELDATNIVVGRVLEGMDVVEKIANLPINRDNSQSAYFRIAKTIGDSRAKVAERGFNRPLVRVLVSRSGLLSH